MQGNCVRWSARKFPRSGGARHVRLPSSCGVIEIPLDDRPSTWAIHPFGKWPHGQCWSPLRWKKIQCEVTSPCKLPNSERVTYLKYPLGIQNQFASYGQFAMVDTYRKYALSKKCQKVLKVDHQIFKVFGLVCDPRKTPGWRSIPRVFRILLRVNLGFSWKTSVAWLVSVTFLATEGSILATNSFGCVGRNRSYPGNYPVGNP